MPECEKKESQNRWMTIQANKKELESANQLIQVLKNKAERKNISRINEDSDESRGCEDEEKVNSDKKNHKQIDSPIGKKMESHENICLFELREKGRCNREKCRFTHDFDDNLRNDNKFIMAVITKHSEKMNFCAVELVSKGECDPNECRFNHDIKLSKIWKDRNANNGESSQSSKPICFKEFSEKQSCPYDDECHFDHKFPDSLRHDPKVASRIKEEREKKASKCVN